MIIPEGFIRSVVCIGDIKSDNFIPMGTGFLVGRKTGKKEDGWYPYLVTNKHILNYFISNQNSKMAVRLYEKETHKIKICEVDKEQFSASNNSNIDIAVVSLDADFLENKVEGFGLIDIDKNSYISEELLNDGGGAGTIVYMLGFPMRLIEDNSCTPVCRMGCISRMDKEEIITEKRFLLDIQNFPGNSGSPVFCRGEIYSVNGSKPVQKTALIGIVNSYFPYQESLINSQTNQIVEIRTENSGIAIANPVEFIKELIEQDLKNRSLE